jgi:hypothetical protein
VRSALSRGLRPLARPSRPSDRFLHRAAHREQAVVATAAEKAHMLRCAAIASRQRTADVRLRSSIVRAPCLWIFLSSLQDASMVPRAIQSDVSACTSLSRSRGRARVFDFALFRLADSASSESARKPASWMISGGSCGRSPHLIRQLFQFDKAFFFALLVRAVHSCQNSLFCASTMLSMSVSSVTGKSTAQGRPFFVITTDRSAGSFLRFCLDWLSHRGDFRFHS